MAKRPPGERILMVGTALETQGGISAVVAVLQASGLFRNYDIEYLASHRDGSWIRKLVTAASAWLTFIARLVSGRVGLVHVHMASRASFWRKACFLLTAYAFRVPTIVHLHGAEFRVFYCEEMPRAVQRFARFLFERATLVIALSDSWADWLRTTFAGANVRRLYNPIRLPPRVAFSAREPATVISLGRLGQRKGTFDLVQAVARLSSNSCTMALLLGGDGECEAVSAQAIKLGVRDRVQILGWVGEVAKQALLTRASIFVLPSYNEGMPMSILEAMAAGLPIISTPVGGIPEAVSDGVEGFLVSPGDVDAICDRLYSLLTNSKLRQAMGDAARQKAENNFGAAQVVAQLEDIYAKLGLPIQAPAVDPQKCKIRP